jgi:2-aminoethylphosphonate dioxygenase
VCRELALYPPLLALVGELYGEPPCLFKDKLIFKKPGLRGYKLHQDWPPWPGFPESFNTVVVPFEPVDRANGCTIVYPGYHTRGKLPTVDGGYHETAPGLVDEGTAVPLELEPGDVAVFTAFTPHRSDPNTSARWRRQLFLSYNKRSEGGEQRDRHYQEFQQRWRARVAAQGITDLYYE